MPTIKKYEPSERAQHIIALAREALNGAEEVKTRIKRSTEAALECGRLLLKEREHVRKTLGHGAWESYYELTFSKSIPARTGRQWMAAAHKEDENGNCRFASPSDSNHLRNGILILGLFPSKEYAPPVSPLIVGTPTPARSEPEPAPAYPPPPSVTPTPRATSPATSPLAVAPKGSMHLAIVNRFSAWVVWLKRETQGNVDREWAKQVVKDFAPVRQFLVGLEQLVNSEQRKDGSE